MQHIIGGRAQQQGQAVTTMATDHNQIAVLFFGQAMDFLARLAVSQVTLLWSQLRVAFGEVVQAFAGLVELLLLQHRQVHRHIAAKGHGHGLHHVDQGQLGVAAVGQGLGALDHLAALFGQVDGNQNMGVGHDGLLMGR